MTGSSGGRRVLSLPMEHSHARPDLNRLAVSATNHCLAGCVIGEVLGMVIATALGWGNVASIALAVGLAFLFGYSLTSLPLLRAGLAFAQIAPIALAADTVSIAIMDSSTTPSSCSCRERWRRVSTKLASGCRSWEASRSPGRSRSS